MATIGGPGKTESMTLTANAFGRKEALLLGMLFVLGGGCHSGGFLLLENRLGKMGGFGFYGYWASLDLHNIFQRTDNLGTMWNIPAHGNELGGQAPLQPSSRDSLGSNPLSLERWQRGALRNKGGRG